MTNEELLLKKAELEERIKNFAIEFHNWTKANVIPELKEKFKTDFDIKLRFEIKDDYLRGSNERVVSKYYYLEGDLPLDKRGHYSFHMSCHREKEFHFSPSISSCYPDMIIAYSKFLFELASVASQAIVIDEFIWNHPAMNIEAEKRLQLENQLVDIDKIINQNVQQIKVNYIEQKFKENEGTIRINYITNRSGRAVYTEFVTFKKFQNNEVYVKDSKGSTVICTVDGLFKNLGGKI